MWSHSILLGNINKLATKSVTKKRPEEPCHWGFQLSVRDMISMLTSVRFRLHCTSNESVLKTVFICKKSSTLAVNLVAIIISYSQFGSSTCSPSRSAYAKTDLLIQSHRVPIWQLSQTQTYRPGLHFTVFPFLFSQPCIMKYKLKSGVTVKSFSFSLIPAK